MIFIFLIALIIFGPKKLPEIGRQIGRMMNEFKRASNEFKSQIESEIGRFDTEPPHTILTHVEPPVGTVTSGSLTEEIPPAPEIHVPDVNSTAKAPDA